MAGTGCSEERTQAWVGQCRRVRRRSDHHLQLLRRAQCCSILTPRRPPACPIERKFCCAAQAFGKFQWRGRCASRACKDCVRRGDHAPKPQARTPVGAGLQRAGTPSTRARGAPSRQRPSSWRPPRTATHALSRVVTPLLPPVMASGRRPSGVCSSAPGAAGRGGANGGHALRWRWRGSLPPCPPARLLSSQGVLGWWSGRAGRGGCDW